MKNLNDKKVIHDACIEIRKYISKTKGNCKGIKNIDSIRFFAKVLKDQSITLKTPNLFCNQWLLVQVRNGELDKLIKLTDQVEIIKITKQNKKYIRKSSYKDYRSFLKSDYWKKVRQIVISRDKRCCIKCGRSDNLHVHHKTYEHHLIEHLYLGDLITLCKGCHQTEHGLK